MVGKYLARVLINSLLMRRLRGPFARERGRCWHAHIPWLTHLSDEVGVAHRSPLALYEDGRPLRPAHSPHSEIRAIGKGCYSHWGECVYFSTSDNTDPNTNGRRYTYSVSRWLYQRYTYIPPSLDRLPPVNLRARDASPAQLRADVAATLLSANGYLLQLRGLLPSLAGRTVLEVGPGIHFGVVMLLAAHGARPAVADPYLAAWDDAYHRPFYAALADAAAREFPGADVSGLRALVQARGYPPEVLARHACAVEDLALPSESVDVAFSNAVGEHLADVPGAFRQLYRVTRPGGVGLHQIDFRDHQDFSRPLEFLLWEEATFRREFDSSHRECGNRWRPDEVSAFIRGAGFEIRAFLGNLSCDPGYLEEFLPRLRLARSRYRDCSAEGLRTLSGLYTLRKPENGSRRAAARPGKALRGV